MAVALIIATFGCMIAAAFAFLIAVYAAARGYWASAAGGALLGILALAGMADFMGKVEASYHETIASAKGTTDD